MVKENDYLTEIIRTNRKTLAIQIKEDGRVVVRAPLRMSQKRITDFVEEHQSWIKKTREKVLEKAKQQKTVEKFTHEEVERLADQALEVIPPKVQHFADMVGVTYGRITIRNQKTRWGSCSSKGNLNFNCLLMLAPEYVQDYVVVHELCHRKEMNHSKAFWAEVERILPDYKVAKLWLKEQGSGLIARLG